MIIHVEVYFIMSANYRALVILAFTFSLLANLAVAAVDSASLLREGVTSMAGGDYDPALESFEQATYIDPTNAQAFFFSVAVLNRLGQSAEALERFDPSLFLSSTTGLSKPHPDLAFERGLALLRLQRYEQAKTSLEAYEQAFPGRAQAAEFLGRGSYMKVGAGRPAAN